MLNPVALLLGPIHLLFIHYYLGSAHHFLVPGEHRLKDYETHAPSFTGVGADAGSCAVFSSIAVKQCSCWFYASLLNCTNCCLQFTEKILPAALLRCLQTNRRKDRCWRWGFVQACAITFSECASKTTRPYHKGHKISEQGLLGFRSCSRRNGRKLPRTHW